MTFLMYIPTFFSLFLPSSYPCPYSCREVFFFLFFSTVHFHKQLIWCVLLSVAENESRLLPGRPQRMSRTEQKMLMMQTLSWFAQTKVHEKTCSDANLCKFCFLKAIQAKLYPWQLIFYFGQISPPTPEKNSCCHILCAEICKTLTITNSAYRPSWLPSRGQKLKSHSEGKKKKNGLLAGGEGDRQDMVLSRTDLQSREPHRVYYNSIETWETTQAADAAASRHRDEPDLLLLAGAFPLLVEPCYSRFDWWMDFSREFYTYPDFQNVALDLVWKISAWHRRCWPRRPSKLWRQKWEEAGVLTNARAPTKVRPRQTSFQTRSIHHLIALLDGTALKNNLSTLTYHAIFGRAGRGLFFLKAWKLLGQQRESAQACRHASFFFSFPKYFEAFHTSFSCFQKMKKSNKREINLIKRDALRFLACLKIAEWWRQSGQECCRLASNSNSVRWRIHSTLTKHYGPTLNYMEI